ncbi:MULTISPECIES: Ig-like domain-containing protein, partial [unclassified Pseudomonas]|uniref:Ig-like domain-containing protein n=1 Tax=unclassified Pseudomonas TaxID=196821 RepID=UPI001F5976AC
VTDQLLNGPDPDAVWSVVLAVPEDLDGTLLNKAILLERIEDYPEQGSGKIELDKLGNNDLSLVILTTDDRFVVDYTINATYTAKINGQPDRVVLVEGKVEADPFGAKKTCIIEVLNEHVIDASSVTVTYELLDLNGALVAKSAPTTEPVVGTHLELKPPSVLQANGATLAPLDALTQLTIVVPPGPTRPTDLLSVSWTAKPGTHEDGSITTPPRPISEIGLNIPIAPALMAYCLGDEITVSYSITRDGNSLPSETLTLAVLDLPQSALIAPRLKEAANAGEGAELNLIDLTPEGKMWCPGFPLIAEGQPVWLLFKGTNANDTPYERYVWEGSFAYVNADWVRESFFESTAPYEDLQGLKDGMPLTIEMSVGFGKSKDIALAKRFVVRSYSVRAVEDVPPTITSVKGSSSDNEIEEGGVTVETSVTLSGTAANGKNVDILDGAEVQGEATADPVSGIWTCTVRGLSVAPHSFIAREAFGEERPSAARRFTVTALIVPTLDNVLDDKGMEVPDCQATISTTLKLKGTASHGQQVEIYDGYGSSAVSKGIATADEKTGVWEREIEVEVQDALHRLYAQSLYHSGTTYSNVRHVSVIEDLAPTIDSVTGSPSGDEIPEGGTTVETAVTLTGSAAKDQNVRVLDGTTSKGEPTADAATGIWTLTVTGLTATPHSFTAKALYGSGATSTPPWKITVEAFTSLYDFTNFNNRQLNGWRKGPAGSELQFIQSGSGYYLFNNTSAEDDHSGTVLSKTFRTYPGVIYEFRIMAKYDNYPHAGTKLRLLIGSSSSPVKWMTHNFKEYSHIAKATGRELVFLIHNDEGRRDGNDFSIDDILVRSILPQ